MEEKKGLIAEFKEFIMRGNVMDMAIGVVIATAFGAITTSLINNIIMPLIGLAFGGIDLSKWDILLSPEVVDEAGEVVKEASYLGIGTFITAIINFLLIALVIFLVVKAINKISERRKKEEEEEEEAPAEPSAEEVLLTEIRDLLKDKK
jgi:large conductance mechanosensitive channel